MPAAAKKRKGAGMMQMVDIEGTRLCKESVDGIHVLYLEPPAPPARRRLAIFLTGLSGVKEDQVPFLADMAARGYVALAFDNHQHGERGSETGEEILARVFANMRRYGWPILGQTVIDTLRVIDWAIATLGVEPDVHMGGISMGGDITIAAAGVDSRIVRCAPIITTPDWLRPGMHDLMNPTKILDPGKPDAYAQFFYDAFNPVTHLGRYVNCPPMRLVQGAEDNHIPTENAERFKRQLADLSAAAAARIDIRYVPGPKANHVDVLERTAEWWPELLEWWLP